MTTRDLRTASIDLEQWARDAWDTVCDALPTVAGALGALLGLYVAARVLRRVLASGLARTRLDHATEATRLGRVLQAIQPGLAPSRALASLVYLFTLLAAWMVALDLLGVPAVRDTLGALLGYAPRLASAILIVTLGAFLAAGARRVVTALLEEVRSPLARVLGNLAELLLLVVVITLALAPLGADTTIITANLTIGLGLAAALVVFLLAWAMRRPAEQIIANYYLRRLLAVGDEIELGGVRGEVTGFAPLGVLVRGPDGVDHLVPAPHVLDGLRRHRRGEAGTGA